LMELTDFWYFSYKDYPSSCDYGVIVKCAL